MGSGKSSVGKALAQLLDVSFLDLDEQIEIRENATIAEIFRMSGETGFRSIETAALKQLIADRHDQGLVLALGGGTVVIEENIRKLDEHGAKSIFLGASAEVLWDRCVDSLDAGVRPLLKDFGSFKKLYEERLPFYKQAYWQIDTANRSVAEVTAEIVARIRVSA